MSHNTFTPEHIEAMKADYISNELQGKVLAQFELWLSENPAIKAELDELKQFNQHILVTESPNIPEPSSHMDQAFYNMLAQDMLAQEALDQDAAKETAQGKGNHSKIHTWLDSLVNWFQLPKVQKFAYGMGFMVFGVFIGHYGHLINQQDNIVNERLAMKNQQVQALAVLSMLDMPSANKRLMAVQLAGLNDSPNNQVMDALLATLTQDDNVNVRLEALDVLANHTGNQQVRTGLINAIGQQESPMLQIALTNLMLLLEEKEAITPIKQLIEQPEVMDSVKSQLNQTLNELI